MKVTIDGDKFSAAHFIANTTPETLQRFFGTQPEIATDGATVTTDGSRDSFKPVDSKEPTECPE